MAKRPRRRQQLKSGGRGSVGRRKAAKKLGRARARSATRKRGHRYSRRERRDFEALIRGL